MTNMQAVFQLVKSMTAEEIEQLVAFAEEQLDKQPPQATTPRILGLHANFGPAWMSDDFNDPLPDDFWFPDDDILYT